MQTYQVRDGARLLTFEGDRLGYVSSKRPGNPRWTEMSVYRTQGGQYILEKVGVSRVMHMSGCPNIIQKIPRFQEAHPGADPEDNDFQYDSCVPDEYDFTKLLVEEDRFWATIAERPDKIVDALYRLRDGVRTMPRISLNLLEEVSQSDPSFGTDWRIEKVL